MDNDKQPAQTVDSERAAAVVIDGAEYTLLLTTRATKEIAKRYGGLENLGDQLMKADSFDMALEEICWLIALLANQTIMIHNLRNKGKQKPLLTVDEIELLTSPTELASYKPAITEALFKGAMRHIESEDDGSKNADAG